MLRGLIRRAAKHGQAHAAVAVNAAESGKRTVVSSVSVTGGSQMADDEKLSEELTEDELERQQGEELPERTQMSILRMPIESTLPVVPPEVD